MDLLRIYCQSVNKEFQHNALRVRQKPLFRLKDMKNNFTESNLRNYVSTLPTLGFSSLNQHYDVNSILFLKTNDGKNKILIFYIRQNRLT